MSPLTTTIQHPFILLPAGIAHTFFCSGMDKPRAGELINVLKEANQPVREGGKREGGRERGCRGREGQTTGGQRKLTS